jgi:hypothetical protein
VPPVEGVEVTALSDIRGWRGEYVITVTADALGQITELRKDNNSASIHVVVRNPSRPQLGQPSRCSDCGLCYIPAANQDQEADPSKQTILSSQRSKDASRYTTKYRRR